MQKFLMKGHILVNGFVCWIYYAGIDNYVAMREDDDIVYGDRFVCWSIDDLAEHVGSTREKLEMLFWEARYR